MRVKYLRNSSLGLTRDEVYRVFSIEISKSGSIKYYIKGESKYIYPFDKGDFMTIESNISNIWKIGYNEFGDMVIGPEKVFNMTNFWQKYYDDEIKVDDLLSLL